MAKTVLSWIQVAAAAMITFSQIWQSLHGGLMDTTHLVTSAGLASSGIAHLMSGNRK